MIDPFNTLRVLLGTLILAASLAGLGRLARGRGGAPFADLAAGLGILGIAVLVLVRFGLALSHAMAPLLILGLAVWLLGLRGHLRPSFGLRVALLHLPLVALAAAIPLVAWDDFSHWLPNALFMLRWDAFPGPGLPAPESYHDTYPPGTALTTIGVALIGRSLLGLDALPETAASVMTVLLFGTLAAGLGGAIREKGLPPWLGAGLALLVVVWINPGFIPSIVFTNYGDAPTAALLGIALLLMLRARETGDPWTVLQAGLVLAAVANVKQTGIAIAAIGTGAAALLILADRRPGAPRRLTVLAAAFLPAALVWLLWRRHAGAATGSFALKPFAEWAWALAPRTLASMGKVAVSKAAFTSVLLGAAVAGVAVLRRGPRSRAGAAALVLAASALGWAGALFMLYMAATFHPFEVAAAASFWRYMSHLSGCVGVVLALALLEWRWLAARLAALRERARTAWWRRAGPVLPLLVLLLPSLALGQLWPQAREPAPPLRRAAVALRPLVEGGRGVVVVDPRGNGMTYVALSFAWRGIVPTHWVATHSAPEALPAAEWQRRVDATGAEFVMLCSTDPGVEAAFGTGPLAPRRFRFLRREDGQGWRQVSESDWR